MCTGFASWRLTALASRNWPPESGFCPNDSRDRNGKYSIWFHEWESWVTLLQIQKWPFPPQGGDSPSLCSVCTDFPGKNEICGLVLQFAHNATPSTASLQRTCLLKIGFIRHVEDLEVKAQDGGFCLRRFPCFYNHISKRNVVWYD